MANHLELAEADRIDTVNTHYMQRQQNGDWIDWGRHGPGGGYEPAKHYSGESAKVFDVLLGVER